MTVSTALLDRLRELRANTKLDKLVFRSEKIGEVHDGSFYPLVRSSANDSPRSFLGKEWRRLAALIVALVNNAESLIAAAEAGARRPIADAPKDGTLIDVWCVDPDEERGSNPIRLTDVAWYDANTVFPYTGWVRVLDDGDLSLVEGEQRFPIDIPAWKPTRYAPIPAPPTAEAK